MGRKRTPPLDGSEQQVKYSFLLSADQDRKILEICRLYQERGRHLSQSELLRKILEENLDRYLQEAGGSTKTPGKVQIQVNEPVRAALDLAALSFNIDLQSLMSMVLAQHLPTLLTEARARRDELQQAMNAHDEKPQQQHADRPRGK